MRFVGLSCLLLLFVLLIPSTSNAQWWKRQSQQTLPDDLNFYGEAEGFVYSKEYQTNGNSRRGRWARTPVCEGEGEFCATTHSLNDAVTLSESSNGTPQLTFCPIRVEGDDCTICIEINGPVKLKSYGVACTFKGSGTARVTGDGQETDEGGIGVKVRGFIIKRGGNYILCGKIYGYGRVDDELLNENVLRAYQFVCVTFCGQGESEAEPCECEVGCDECDDDQDPPVITCPADVTLECGDDTSPDDTGSATATDDCDEDVEITSEDEVERGKCLGSGTVTRTWTATDSSGNSSECVQVITVEDTTPPTIQCPPDIAVRNGQQNDFDIVGRASGNDSCSLVTIEITNLVIDRDNSLIFRTWTVTDACGNEASCTQTIAVDRTLPTVR